MKDLLLKVCRVVERSNLITLCVVDWQSAEQECNEACAARAKRFLHHSANHITAIDS